MSSKDGKCGGLVGSDPSTKQGKGGLRERGKAGGLWAQAIHTGQGTPVDRQPHRGISVSEELVFPLPAFLFESPFPLRSAETAAQGSEPERARLNCALLSGSCLQWLLIKKKKRQIANMPK